MINGEKNMTKHIQGTDLETTVIDPEIRAVKCSYMRFFLFTCYTYDTWNNMYDVWKSLKNIEYPNVSNVLIERSSQTPLGYVQEPLWSVKDRVMKLTEFGCTTGNKRVGLVPIKTNVGWENQPEKKRNIRSQALQNVYFVGSSLFQLFVVKKKTMIESLKPPNIFDPDIRKHQTTLTLGGNLHMCHAWLDLKFQFTFLQATSLFFQTISGIWKV